MRKIIRLEVEVNFPVGRASANEIFSEIELLGQSVYEQVSPIVLEAYQELIVGTLCSASGLEAKKGLALHNKKSSDERCRCRRFKRAGYWSKPRCIRGERGEIWFKPALVECHGCGRRLTPVLEALELNTRQGHTDLLLRKLVEAVSDTSYRRAMDQLSVLAEVPVAKSTAHQWVADVELPTGTSGSDDLLTADGTGFKKVGGKKGQARLVLKIGADNEIHPVGVWAGQSWETIASEVKEQQNGQSPLFFSDGERGLEDWLGKLAGSSQRCQWHAVRETGYALWEDGVNLKKRRVMQKQVGQLMAIEIPEEDLEYVSERDKENLRSRIRQAEAQLDALCQTFEATQCPKAATYLRRARDQMFSHLRLWIDTGIIAPRTTSIVENIIRELVRRLKKVGWNWSDEGAARMGRIVMMRRYDQDGWNQYWNDRINLRGRCKLRLIKCELAYVA